MIRKLSILCAAAALMACQPAAPATVPATADGVSILPADWDWAWRAHGSWTSLDFGEVDRIEGPDVFTLSCRPNTGAVELGWGETTPVVVTAGGVSGTFEREVSTPVSHPVIAGLRQTGSLHIRKADGHEVTLAGKAAGKAAIKRFFDYCTTPSGQMGPA